MRSGSVPEPLILNIVLEVIINTIRTIKKKNEKEKKNKMHYLQMKTSFRKTNELTD